MRGTVRSKTNEAKIGPLKAALGSFWPSGHYQDKLEIVEADLTNEASVIAACEGCDYIVHVASPFFFSDDESTLLPPAINGTKAVMKAC